MINSAHRTVMPYVCNSFLTMLQIQATLCSDYTFIYKVLTSVKNDTRLLKNFEKEVYQI